MKFLWQLQKSFAVWNSVSSNKYGLFLDVAELWFGINLKLYWTGLVDITNTNTLCLILIISETAFHFFMKSV